MNLTSTDIIIGRVRTKAWVVLVGPWLCLLELVGLVFEFDAGTAQEWLMWKTRWILR